MIFASRARKAISFEVVPQLLSQCLREPKSSKTRAAGRPSNYGHSRPRPEHYFSSWLHEKYDLMLFSGTKTLILPRAISNTFRCRKESAKTYFQCSYGEKSFFYIKTCVFCLSALVYCNDIDDSIMKSKLFSSVLKFAFYVTDIFYNKNFF